MVGCTGGSAGERAMPVDSPKTTAVAMLLAAMPPSLTGRLAPGSADTLGILACRLLVLPIVEVFILLRVSPSIVTTASYGIFFAGLAALVQGMPAWSGLGIGLGALLDFADGMVARRAKRTSRFGFQYDYIMDRAKSAGLFCVIAYLTNDQSMRVTTLAALALLIVREGVTWLIPIRRSPVLFNQSAWPVIFGRWHLSANELLRNDPWQLVLLGIVLFTSASGLWLPLGYYYLTLLVDSLVYFRSFVNFGQLKDPDHPHLLYWGAEGRMKTAVANAFGRVFRH